MKVKHLLNVSSMMADAASCSTPDASSNRGKMSLSPRLDASRSSSRPAVTRSTSEPPRASALEKSSSPSEDLAPCVDIVPEREEPNPRARVSASSSGKARKLTVLPYFLLGPVSAKRRATVEFHSVTLSARPTSQSTTTRAR